MDDVSLIRSLGIVRPSARTSMKSFDDAFPDAVPRPGERRRVFDERRTIGLMLGQAINRNAPCKDAVRRTQIEYGQDASSSTSAFCKARARVRVETVRKMSTRLSEEADAQTGFRDFTRVWALDGTTFQANDTDENRAEWPYTPGQKPGCGLPMVGALIAHSLVGGGSVVLSTASWKAHDFRLYVDASHRFEPGDLHIADRAFCSYAAFAILQESKADGIFRGKDWCRRARPDDVDLGPGDRLTIWGKWQARHCTTVDKKKQAEFPDQITVRIITAKIRCRGYRDEDIIVVTSLLDPVKFPKETILEWYFRRWEVEVSFRDMKTTLRYEFIRGKTPKIVKLEIEILLLAYNLMRYVIAKANSGSVKPRCGIASAAAAVKSFLSAIQTVFRTGGSCARAFARLLKAIRSDKLPRRRRKAYARVVKRRPKTYRLLNKPRSQYTEEVTK